MFHYVYCIENLINGKVYVGKHSTSNLDDEYMGSGTLLNRAIKKHGVENFRKHILETFQTSEEALEFEKQLVTEELVADDNTYNLTVGGFGSWSHATKEQLSEWGKRAIGNLLEKVWSNSDFRQRHSERISKRNKQYHATGKFHHVDWTGRHHSEETRQRMRISHANIDISGTKNPMYGRAWIHNDVLKQSRLVKIEELNVFLEQGWSKGRKRKWN